MAFQFVITPGYVFTPSEAVTYAKLNKMLSLAYANVLSGTLDTAQIGDLQVTAAKLASSLDLSGKTLTLPTNLQPKTGITATTTVPDFIGQWGVTSGGIWYVATGTSAGNWKSMNCLLIETQWNADATNFPEKTSLANDDWFLIEDSAASFAKKKMSRGTLASDVSIRGGSTRLLVHLDTLSGTITAKEVTLINASGEPKIYRNVSVTCALATAGAGGVGSGFVVAAGNRGAIFLIGKEDGTISSLLQADTSEGVPPTFPTGYTYYRRVEVINMQSGGLFPPLIRNNNLVMLSAPRQIFSNTTLTTSLVEFSLTPTGDDWHLTNVSRLYFTAGTYASSTDTTMVVSPGNDLRYSAVAYNDSATSINAGLSSLFGAVDFDIPIPVAVDALRSSIYAKSYNSGASVASQCLYLRGYECEVDP